MAQSFVTEPTFTPGTLTQLFEWEFVGQRNRRTAVSPDGDRFLLFNYASDDENALPEDVAKPGIILVPRE